ncbi:MAG TPA: hypothetical protein PKE55_13875 [Kiritimatiellia bacterium]|nr:hypothetical protein [Kiritimatiellia bacterium]
MKKLALAIAGSAIIAAGAYAQQVLSRNAVGYVKLDIAKGTLALVHNPFLPLQSPTLTVTNLFGNQLPNGSALFIWDPASQSYLSETRTFAGWLPGTNALDPGRGFFINIPASAVSNNYTVFMMGEVPDRFTQPTASLGVVSGLNLLGFPYPTQEFWTNTTLAASLPSGSAVFIWNQGTQSYSSETRTFAGWLPGTALFQPGQAFFVNTSAGSTWNVVKPYTWP